MTGELRHPAWCKSTYSSSQANCVEVALGRPAIGVRDFKVPDGLILAVPAGHWSAFLGGVAVGQFGR